MEAPVWFDPSNLPGLPLCQQNCSVPVPCDDEPTYVLLPYYESAVACGFPSPADDYVGAVLDLNDLVVRNPPATFFLRASGDSMVGAGIFDGDLVVVDRSVEAQPGDIVVAEVDGAFTLKRYAVRQGRKMLVPENEAFPVIHFGAREEIAFFGVVTFTVKAHGRRRA